MVGHLRWRQAEVQRLARYNQIKVRVKSHPVQSGLIADLNFAKIGRLEMLSEIRHAKRCNEGVLRDPKIRKCAKCVITDKEKEEDLKVA